MLSLLGILIAGALLGVAVWVAGIGVLAWVVSRPALRMGTLVRAGAALGVIGVVYVLTVILVRLGLPA